MSRTLAALCGLALFVSPAFAQEEQVAAAPQASPFAGLRMPERAVRCTAETIDRLADDVSLARAGGKDVLGTQVEFDLALGQYLLHGECAFETQPALDGLTAPLASAAS